MNKTSNHIYRLDSTLRISSQEIDSAIQQLEIAYTDGRLNEEELEERMASALKAKTEGDLAILLGDLRIDSPALLPTTRVERNLAKLTNSIRVIFSGVEKKGNFILPKDYRITAIMGGCFIDLRKAHLESLESSLHITAIMGGVQILVPRGVRVEIHGSPIMGGIAKNIKDDAPSNDAPVIHIFAKVIMGGVEIKTKK